MLQETKTDIFAYFEKMFEELFVLESVVKFTKEACLEREINSEYYSLALADKAGLSEERNHYINMLSIALEKVNSLKTINSSIEKGLIDLKQNSDYSCR